MKHLLDIESLSIDNVESIFENAMKYKEGFVKNEDKLSNKIIATVFLEPSTRTQLSFQAACYRLDGKVINYEDAKSSSKKGESFEDTIKTISQYVDAIVLRHPEKGKVHHYASFSNVPVINAGDGNGEHPTQALLDVFTMLLYVDFYSSSPVRIAFVGDLKNGRTVHSTVKLLDKLYDNLEFYFISQEGCNLEDQSYIKNKIYVKENLSDEISNLDVVYMTRIQKERNADLQNVYSKNVLTKELMKKAKENMIVMHPLPRNDEIPPEIDEDIRCKYVEQMKNGMYVRMSILKCML